MRILLCEDEKALSRVLCALLEKNNYSVDAVYDGISALDYARCGNYDVMILDISLPGIDGFSVLRQLREEGNSTPILVLTARSEVEDKVKGLDMGADDYLTKPFATAELLARLRVLTRKDSVHSSSTMAMGNITLSTITHELSSPYGSYKLANREYRMMEALMHHPGMVLSTETLIEKVWGYDSDTENSVVWVYVSYLRKKLNALHGDIEIRALRNTGYSLEKKS